MHSGHMILGIILNYIRSDSVAATDLLVLAFSGKWQLSCMVLDPLKDADESSSLFRNMHMTRLQDVNL